MKHNKNTKQWIGVFFVLACISFVGIIWQWQRTSTSTLKVRGGEFSEGVIGTPRFINPVLAQSQSDKDLTQLIFGNIINPNFPEGQLAKKIVQGKNKKEYILELKNDIYFQDETKITSDDVLFTVEKIQDPQIKSPLYNKWTGIDAEKIDAQNIKFTLNQEYADFPSNLHIGVLPKHLWREVPAEEFIFNSYNIRPIGSGPYTVEKISYSKEGIPRSYTLKPSKKSTAFIQHIKLSFFENEQKLIEAFKAGKIEAVYGITANQKNKELFETESSITEKLPRIFALFYNQQKNIALKNKNIRNYIDAALDREELINKVFAGYAYPIESPLGKDLEEKYSQEKLISARTLIEKDGWVKENDIYTKVIQGKKQALSFTLSIPNTSDLMLLATEIKEELWKEGVEIQIHPFEPSTLEQKVIRPRDYDILLFGYILEKKSDLFAFWHSSQSNDPGLNISLYSNKKVDTLLEELRNKKNPETLQKIELEIKKDIPASFIYSPAFTYILPKKIKGVNKLNLVEKDDRFSTIENWYVRTRKLWKIFIK